MSVRQRPPTDHYSSARIHPGLSLPRLTIWTFNPRMDRWVRPLGLRANSTFLARFRDQFFKRRHDFRPACLILSIRPKQRLCSIKRYTCDLIAELITLASTARKIFEQYAH